MGFENFRLNVAARALAAVRPDCPHGLECDQYRVAGHADRMRDSRRRAPRRARALRRVREPRVRGIPLVRRARRLCLEPAAGAQGRGVSGARVSLSAAGRQVPQLESAARGEPSIPRSAGRARERRADLPRRQRRGHADEPRGESAVQDAASRVIEVLRPHRPAAPGRDRGARRRGPRADQRQESRTRRCSWRCSRPSSSFSASATS